MNKKLTVFVPDGQVCELLSDKMEASVSTGLALTSSQAGSCPCKTRKLNNIRLAAPHVYTYSLNTHMGDTIMCNLWSLFSRIQ